MVASPGHVQGLRTSRYRPGTGVRVPVPKWTVDGLAATEAIFLHVGIWLTLFERVFGGIDQIYLLYIG